MHDDRPGRRPPHRLATGLAWLGIGLGVLGMLAAQRAARSRLARARARRWDYRDRAGITPRRAQPPAT